VENASEKIVNEVVDTNIKGSYFMTKSCLPEIINSKGSVLFISSIASFYGLPNHSLYSLSKSALLQLFQSLELEMHGKGVFVGISYLSFTKNDTDKYAYNENGNKIEVPNRSKFLVFSKEQTVKFILHQLCSQKRIATQGKLGKFLSFLRRLPIIQQKLFRIGNALASK